MLWAGITLTVVAWLALVLVAAHGRYVTEAVAAGEYEKGPFRERGPEQDPDANADEREQGGDAE